MKRVVLFAILAIGFAAFRPVYATPTPSMLAHPCAGCHGPNGVSIGAIPSLQGYPKEVIVSALNEFRAGSRPVTIMGRIARGYSDEEIDALGEYFSHIP